MKKWAAPGALILSLSVFAFAQVSGNLLWPLPSSQTLTGGFADTRADHFHGGVDLRARTPEPVVAPTDGWIERMAVHPSGYGRVLYFRLDDGRTAVFAHLSQFAAPIEEALRDSQIVAGTYRVDVIYPEPIVEMKFARGATLAWTGKTGVGPAHLHFEIREGAVQTDPLANYPPHDRDKPVISGLWWTTTSSYSPMSLGTRLEASAEANSRWHTHQHQPINEREPVAFFIQTYDPGPWGRHAVPSVIRIRVRDAVVHEEHPARIDLAAPKDFYEEIVWSERKRYDRDVRRLLAPPPPNYYRISPQNNEGWLSGLQNEEVTIEVEDRAGNVATARVPVSCGNFDTLETRLPPRELNSAAFSLRTDDVTLAWVDLQSTSPHEISAGPPDFAFARPCTLTYRFAANEQIPGMFIYERTASGGMRALWRIAALDAEDSISCTILRAGTYGVAFDSDPPTVSFSTLHGKLRFKVRDNLSYIDDSTIRCTVDGITAIAEYEYEDSGGFIWTQQPLARGEHDVEISAGDRAGNIGRWMATVRIP